MELLMSKILSVFVFRGGVAFGASNPDEE